MPLYFIVTLGLFLFLLLIIIVRTLLFRPQSATPPQPGRRQPDREHLLRSLPQLLKCRTVSHREVDTIDFAKFSRFKALLPNLYPLVHTHCTREEISRTGLLYRWPGKSAENPTVLMSHYDVVPVEEEFWTRPAFEGLIADDCIWGRGTLDTKSTLCAILEAAENLLSAGFTPEHDLYFSFSGDEEISGPSAPAIVAALQERGIRPALVLDEGGAIVENIFPGVSRPVAVVGSGEKGYMDIDMELHGPGGHSSTPPAHSLAGILAKAIVQIEKHPFPATFTPPVLEMFKTLGRQSSFGLRLIFANLWLFKPLLAALFHKKGGQLDAMIRTTTAVTKLSGSQAYNVMPPKAVAGINFRLLGNENAESVIKHLRRIAKNPDLRFTVGESREASPSSKTTGPAWEAVSTAIRQTWPEVVVTPYLMLAATDSRHFCAISDCVLRFSAMRLSKEELNMIHGHDERITITNLMETVTFYLNLVEAL